MSTPSEELQLERSILGLEYGLDGMNLIDEIDTSTTKPSKAELFVDVH